MKKFFISLFILIHLVVGNTFSNSRYDNKKTKTALMWFDATGNFERFSHPDSVDFYLKKIKLGLNVYITSLNYAAYCIPFAEMKTK